MSLTRVSATAWRLTVPVGDYNYELAVRVTSEGIEFEDDGVMTWAEINAAFDLVEDP